MEPSDSGRRRVGRPRAGKEVRITGVTAEGDEPVMAAPSRARVIPTMRVVVVGGRRPRWRRKMGGR